MNYQQYTQLFDHILSRSQQSGMYQDEKYFNYTVLNKARSSRWDKTIQLNDDLIKAIGSFPGQMHWIIISEHWCGDAAHAVPFLAHVAEACSNVSYDIQLRDTEPFLIESYLTNGARSIPKLIARNQSGIDLFTWGPRPASAQKIMTDAKAANVNIDTAKIQLQNWYNADKGQSLMTELHEIIKNLQATPVPQ